MKKLLFLMTAAIAAMSLCAAPIDQAAATKVAKKYLAEEMYAGKIMAPAALNPVLLKTEIGNEKMNKPVYYIFNTSTTFLVVAAEDRAETILMVGDRPLKDINNLPPAMQDILNLYKTEIQFLHENPNLKVDKISDRRMSLRAVTYGPMLTAMWDQEAPYNNLCKFTYNNRSYTCLTGCPATSAAIVMYHWKCPDNVGAIASYTSTLDIGSYYSNEVSFTYPALTATTFDWDNMKDTYRSYTTAQGNAVATLMRYIGQAEQMMYGVTGSGIYTNQTNKVANMFKNWGYSSNCRVVYKSSYSETNWANLIIGELAAGRPIIYNGVDNSSGGHAFNVDGYRDSDNKYHVNFGWSGDGNNWYAMNAFTYSGYTFSSGQQAVIGIEPAGGPQPTPELTANPASLTFTEGSTGSTYTKTFTVSGTDLQGDVTISKSGSTYFTVSPTTLTKEQAQAGATITVTYKPVLAGTHTGTITIASKNATSKTVSLSGSASNSVSLSVNPTSLTMTSTVDTPVTGTFVVTGNNLTNNVTLSVQGLDKDCFSIDKMTILKSAAADGVTVTVTFTPYETGPFNASVVVASQGAESVTVALTGTGEAPQRAITVDPAALTFEAVVGQTVSKTFHLTGTNLTGALSLALNDANGYYSITPRTVTASRAASGVDVTVTYAPTEFGNHNATVTISGGDADPVNVSLNGVATLTKFTPIMQAAVEEFINLTSFRADWTDATPAENVASYTLEVAAVSTEPVPVDGGVADFTGIEAVTNENSQLPNVASTASQYLPEGWTAENILYINDGFVISGASTSWWSSTYGALVSPVLDLTGYDKVTVVARVKSYYPSNYGQAQIRILTGSAYQDFTLGSSDDDDYQTVTAVLNCSASDQVKIQGRAKYFALEDVKIYAGDITETAKLMAVETGDEAYRLVTGITDKFYTVENLTAEGTFLYKVKALYLDGTESDWSNVEEVTLFENGHGFVPGDLNHNGELDIEDLALLIDYVLDSSISTACPICADVDQSGEVDIKDVADLIDMVLGGETAITVRKPFYLLEQ